MSPSRDPERDPLFRALVLLMVLALGVALVFDGLHQRTARAEVQTPAGSSTATTVSGNSISSYTPVTRQFVVAAVPLLVHEQTATFGYLNKDFGKSGVLNGKELWGFSPSSFTVYQGDTVQITVINAGDDPHTFTIAAVGFNLQVPPRATASGSFVVPKPGPFMYFCTIPEHSPYMWGQLVVLPDSAAG